MSDVVLTFPADHREFAGLKTGLTAAEFLAAGGKSSAYALYKAACVGLQFAHKKANMTDAERTLEQRKQALSVGLGVGLVTAVAGTFVANELEAFHANPAEYSGATARLIRQILADKVDDNDTNLTDTDEGIVVIDGVDRSDGGTILFVITVKDVRGGATVEIRRPAEAVAAEPLPAEARSALDSLLMGDLNGAKLAALAGVSNIAQTVGKTASVTAQDLAATPGAVLMWNELWSKLDDALGQPKKAGGLVGALAGLLGNGK